MAAQQRYMRNVTRGIAALAAVTMAVLLTALPAQAATWIRPADGSVSSTYGPRWGKFHYGIDITDSQGTTVRAASAGTVIYVQNNANDGGERGKYLKILHDDGSVTLYQHFASISVNASQSVGTGQVIGVMGQTGSAMGVHLHFETFTSTTATTPVDPVGFMEARGINLFDTGSQLPTPNNWTDMDGDGIGDLVAKRADGTLWLYRGNGAGAFQSAIQIGNGWGSYDTILTPGDFDDDGNNDIIARLNDGTMWLFRGKGTGFLWSRVQIGHGWGGFTRVLSAGDLSGDGLPDVLSIDTAGKLKLHTGQGDGTFLTSWYIGNGWATMTSVTAPGDLDGDGRDDLVGRKADGTLWLYPGDGDGTWGTARQIGTGWNIYDTILGSTDLNGDGRGDIVARAPDGKLYFYAVTGDANFSSRTEVGFGWTGLLLAN